ncbi:Pentapeptide repeat family protein [Richelia intracellularis]|nr:Pentapeptide repeat family protein [Richelia intracellularis]
MTKDIFISGMKKQILAGLIALSSLGFYPTAQAANAHHVRQLLATKECEGCDLSGAGLVMADLSGANLRGANLTGANLSSSNLSGANLQGANLSGSSLFGVNLSGANLCEVNLTSSDLRSTYLVNAQFTNTNLNGANWEGAVGIPLEVAKPEKLYALGVSAAQKGNQEQAITYFNQAIALKPGYAGAYLARGVARYQLFDSPGALQDAQMAEKFFYSQGNSNGLQTAQAFIVELQTPRTAKVDKGKPNFVDFVGGVGSVLLNLFAF